MMIPPIAMAMLVSVAWRDVSHTHCTPASHMYAQRRVSVRI